MEIQRRGPKRISVLYPLPDTAEQQPEKAKKKLRVAAYCRVSSGSEEQRVSLNNQMEYYKKHIQNNPNYILVEIYTDQGISGTDLRKRDAFNRLMEDCRAGHIDRIITKSVSRFGRNTLDSLKSIRELRSIGVDVFFEKENIHSLRSEGELLLTLISAMAQNESHVLSGNVKWGIHRRYERGMVQSIPSGKFLGYDKDEQGNLVINEAQAAIVRRIYKEFLEGHSYCHIATRLEKDGILTERGNRKWSWSVIKRILTNEKMKGDTVFQKTFNADPLTKKRVRNRGELPQYYFENTHPAIIDKETWQCVQLEFARQDQYMKEHLMSRFHHLPGEKYGFVGKITCKHCGRIYLMRHTEDKSREYWRCSGYKYETKGNSDCRELRIDGDFPERAFIAAWNELVENRITYEEEWKHTLARSDMLQRYRAKELMCLVRETGPIEKYPYELVLKTLGHIEIGNDGLVEVIFLAGTRLRLGFNICEILR